jgi:hypothetical protein
MTTGKSDVIGAGRQAMAALCRSSRGCREGGFSMTKRATTNQRFPVIPRRVNDTSVSVRS